MPLTSTLLAVISLGTGAPRAECATPPVVHADTLQAIWLQGVPFGEFLAATKARHDQWVTNYAASAPLDATLVARAAAVAGRWRLLVVAVDSCSDSVSTVPWIAKLADQLPNIELRVVLPEVGRAVMEAHRTPDGRAATPTVVLLDETGALRGCFIERPPALRAHLDSLSGMERKMAWYAADAGRQTVTEMVTMLEAAAAGGMQCR